MRILLTNDDGFRAPGLLALGRAVADLGEVTIVVPEAEQTAASHAVTVGVPIPIRRVQIDDDLGGQAVDGRPADCVKLACLALLDARPDFVLSGTNVNIPALEPGPPPGVRVCPQDLTVAPAAYRKTSAPDGRDAYVLIPGDPAPTGRADTDMQVVLQRYVTVTPLNLAFSADGPVAELSRWAWPQTFP